MSLTTEQLEARRAYLGGTDAPAIVGVNPPGWSQPIDVWAEKHGLAAPRPQSKLMGLGTLMEGLVVALAEEATGWRWRMPPGTGQVVSRQYPWAGGHVDRYAGRQNSAAAQPGLERALLECKWAQRKDGWGESFTLGAELQPPVVVPLHYGVQVDHYLAVTGRPRAVLAVLLGYADFRWYVIERDEHRLANLMALEEDWWAKHGPPHGVAPDPDGSEQYTAHLRRVYAESSDAELVATPEQQLLAIRLRTAVADERNAHEAAEQLRQQLMTSMADAGKLVGPGWQATWRRNRPTLKVEWEALATEQLKHEFEAHGEQWPATKKAQAELVRQVARDLELAHEEPGARPFRVQFDSDEDTDASTT